MRLIKFSGQTAVFFAVSIHVFTLISCTQCVLPGSNDNFESIVFMSYNVQNIFDDVDNGTEYSEFDPGKGNWGTSQYHTRLYNLSEVIRRSVSGGPDIIALQEVENENVCKDLVDGYLKGMGYSFLTVTETAKSPIQLGIISRLVLNDIRIHQILLGESYAGRPILEASIYTESGTIHIFNNHWKSKSGGAEQTEPARIAAASLLGRRIFEISTAGDMPEIVVLGDLNENWNEYRLSSGDYPTALMPFEDSSLDGNPSPVLIASPETEGDIMFHENSVVLISPWRITTNSVGSYNYNDSWETIDHVLLSYGMFDDKGYEFESFGVMDDDFLMSSNGYPLEWKSATSYGYSDHLPLMLEIKLH